MSAQLNNLHNILMISRCLEGCLDIWTSSQEISDNPYYFVIKSFDTF